MKIFRATRRDPIRSGRPDGGRDSHKKYPAKWFARTCRFANPLFITFRLGVLCRSRFLRIPPPLSSAATAPDAVSHSPYFATTQLVPINHKLIFSSERKTFRFFFLPFHEKKATAPALSQTKTIGCSRRVRTKLFVLTNYRSLFETFLHPGKSFTSELQTPERMLNGFLQKKLTSSLKSPQHYHRHIGICNNAKLWQKNVA